MARNRPRKKKAQAAARNQKEGKNIAIIIAIISVILLVLLYLGYSAVAS